MAPKYINALQLSNMEIVGNDEIIKGILPPGVSILAAPQKLGKTLFALQLANAITNGNTFLNYEVDQGSVLYIAFEDPKKNVKERLITFDLQCNKDLSFLFCDSNSTVRIASEISQFQEYNSNLKLVVVDTFAKIRATNQYDYNAEYKEVANLHDIAIKNNLCVLLVTHITKKMDYKNPFDCIYGSRGVTAAADSMMVMLANQANQEKIELHITGKDIVSKKINLLRNEKLVYEITEDEVEEEYDEYVIKVINYIVSKKNYQGTLQNLCSLLNLPIAARSLSVRLNKNSKLLEENYIVYKQLERTANARGIKMDYIGDDAIKMK